MCTLPSSTTTSPLRAAFRCLCCTCNARASRHSGAAMCRQLLATVTQRCPWLVRLQLLSTAKAPFKLLWSARFLDKTADSPRQGTP